MVFEAKLKFAKQADRHDPLRKFRKAFYFPATKKGKAVYLCGNSLGVLSKNVKPAINQELKDWKNKAFRNFLSGSCRSACFANFSFASNTIKTLD